MSRNDTSCCRNRTAAIQFSQPTVCAVAMGVRFYRIFNMQTKYFKRGSLRHAVIIKCPLITKQTDQMQTNNSVAEYVMYADKHQ